VVDALLGSRKNDSKDQMFCPGHSDMKLAIVLAFVLLLIAELTPIALKYVDNYLNPLVQGSCFGLNRASANCCKDAKWPGKSSLY
jgi:hypothetical protein